MASRLIVFVWAAGTEFARLAYETERLAGGRHPPDPAGDAGVVGFHNTDDASVAQKRRLREPWFLPIVVLSAAMAAGAEQTLYPRADGTLADGGVYGPYDGFADAWEWSFNQSSYQGSITLNEERPGVGLEHRLIFEYSLSTVPTTSPVTATLTFKLRGAPRFPAAAATVHVYWYPADLLERQADFSIGPATLVGTESIPPYQPTSTYRLNVSEAVNTLIRGGGNKIGFRFQIDPQTPYAANQAFMDAVDTDPTSKPYLVISENIPGDTDGDRDVDHSDFRAVVECLNGPGAAAPSCGPADFDLDGDVDLRDLAYFYTYYTSFGR